MADGERHVDRRPASAGGSCDPFRAEHRRRYRVQLSSRFRWWLREWWSGFD